MRVTLIRIQSNAPEAPVNPAQKYAPKVRVSAIKIQNTVEYCEAGLDVSQCEHERASGNLRPHRRLRPTVAYNSGDIDTFCACYADDVEVYLLGGELLYRGVERLREQYGPYFEGNPKLHAKLLSRTVQGNFAIDHEHVTGLKSGGEVFAIAIYEVREDIIQKVWFIK